LITSETVDASDDASTPDDDPLDPFFAEGLITAVLRTEKSGKEGTVYCCRASGEAGDGLLAAKVYRSRSRRNFKNDAIYREGRVILNGHDQRAARKKTAWGREFQFASWIGHEYDTLRALHAMGADVPRPISRSGNAILMEYIGDEERAAPMLSGVTLPDDEVRPLFERLLTTVRGLLAANYIHGDLSPYNVLYHEGRAVVIDFPQTVDPRQNSRAFDLLARDVDRVCAYFSRYGVRTDPQRMARHLWERYLRSDL
jgi:RIO kinase 1